MKNHKNNSTFKPWISRSYHVDIDTGELLNKEDAEKNFHKIKTIKHVTIGQVYRLIERTIEHRRNPKQFTIF